MLYFASNRAGGTGLQDLYISERLSIEDPWGSPQNLGISINSGSNEVCPTLSTDGHRLYLVSDSPGGCGGQDLYVSRRRDKRDNFAWSLPLVWAARLTVRKTTSRPRCLRTKAA